MPTVLRVKGYQFIIFTNDHPPPHVHVRRAEGGAKISLDVVEVVEFHKLNIRQLSEIIELVEYNRDYLLEKWREIQGHGDE